MSLFYYKAHSLCPLYTDDKFHKQKIACCRSIRGVTLLTRYPWHKNIYFSPARASFAPRYTHQLLAHLAH